MLVNDIFLKLQVNGYGATHYRISTGNIEEAIWELLNEDYTIHFSLPNKEGEYVVSYQLKNPYNVSEILSENIQYLELVILPKSPENLRYLNLTQTSFRLLWDAPQDTSDLVSYEVYSNGTSVGNTTELYFDVSNLTPNTEYSFTVKIVNSIGTIDNESIPLLVKTLKPEVVSLKGNVTIAQVFSPSSTIVNTQDGVSIDHCFITLYNNSDVDISLNDARIYWKYDAYPTWHETVLSGTIKSKKHFLIRGSKLTGTIIGTTILSNWTLAIPDLDCSVDWTQFVDPNPEDINNLANRMVSWALESNFLYIGSKTGVVYLSNNSVNPKTLPENPWTNKTSLDGYVDMVGLLGKDGINEIGETSPINGVKKSLILNRKQLNNQYIDTDNNASDFEAINTLLPTSSEVTALIKSSRT